MLSNGVEEKSGTQQDEKPNRLKPLERFPTKTQRNDTDEEGATSVDCRPGRSADIFCDSQSRNIEKTRP